MQTIYITLGIISTIFQVAYIAYAMYKTKEWEIDDDFDGILIFSMGSVFAGIFIFINVVMTWPVTLILFLIHYKYLLKYEDKN
jgi:uncharacterized membrane protein